MKKIAVIWWSGSGNTTAMAEAVAAGAEAAGCEVEKFEVSDFEASQVEDFDGFAFGCPAMGAEELEGDEFEPVWDEACELIGDKPVCLFGSYGWGDGEWMETWKEDAEAEGINVIDTLIVNEEPDDEGVELCNKLGAALA